MLSQAPYAVRDARDILYLRGRVPTSRVVRHRIIANTHLHEIRVVIASPYVHGAEAIDHCTVGPVYHTEITSEFDLSPHNGVPEGHPASFAYRMDFEFPERCLPRECRSFAPTGLNKGQVIVVFDPTTPPHRVYNTVWCGPSDGTIAYESQLTPSHLTILDQENKTWHEFPLAVLVDMPVTPGTTFGVRWEWPQVKQWMQEPTPKCV